MSHSRRFVPTGLAWLVASIVGASGCGPTTPEPSSTGGSGGSHQGGMGGMAGAGGMGGMPECSTPADCGFDLVCVTRTCTNGVCGALYAPPGTLWDEQTAVDCKIRVCNGQGVVIDQSDDNDVLDVPNDCTLNQCSNGLPESIAYSAGTACNSNGGKVCNQVGVCVQCLVASDCASKLCMSNQCVDATCVDTLKNGSETDKDCGGDKCLPCADGRGCLVASDCQSGVCEMDKCAVPSCVDGVKNGSEIGVDCGGPCNGCGLGVMCSVNGDCASGYCVGGVCVDAVCGDGIVTGSETCDDGNTNPDDCCSASCQIEVGTGCEIEPNDTDATANEWSAVAIDGEVKAFNDPTSDKDVFRIDVPTGFIGTLTAEVQDGPLGTTCASGNIDSYLSLRDSAEMTLGTDDDAGTGFCSSLTVSNLVPGLYYVEQKRTTSLATGFPTYDYTLDITLSLCGDGAKGSNEGCDDGNTVSGDGCDPSCAIETGYTCTGTPSVCVTACGDGFKAGMETCDDGNTIAGDCCNAGCQVEPGFGCEIEPNDTDATANVWTAIAINNVVNAFNDPTNDKDVFKIDVPAGKIGRLTAEVLDGPLGTTCASGNIDSYLTLRNSAGTTLGANDDTGPGYCSLFIFANLVSGSYYVEQQRTPLDARGFATYDYTLKLTLSICGNGVIESSEQCDDLNVTSGDGCSSACAIETAYDCNGLPSVCTPSETICNDGLDNDGDGSIDGADANCAIPAYFPACGVGQTLRVFKSPSLNIAIPDGNTTGITNTLAIPNIGTIARAAMLYNITHTFDADLDITLKAPGYAAVDVCRDNGSSGDNFVNTVLDSTCTTAVTVGTPPFSGCYKPEFGFLWLIGKSAQGAWTIAVADDEAPDAGMLDNWALIFCIAP